MGETPDQIKRQMNDTKANIESNVAALQTSASATADDVQKTVALSIGDLGAKAGDATAQLVAKQPKLDDPLPLLVASAIVGFVAGFLAPVSSFERKRLGPVGAELMTRVKTAREELLGQSKAIVADTLTAAKSSATKHGKQAADTLGI